MDRIQAMALHQLSSLSGPGMSTVACGGSAVGAWWASAAMPMAMNARNCGNGNAPRNVAYWPGNRAVAIRKTYPVHLGSTRVRRIAAAIQPGWDTAGRVRAFGLGKGTFASAGRRCCRMHWDLRVTGFLRARG